MIIDRFLNRDGRHLSEEGVKVLAANMRFVIEKVLEISNRPVHGRVNDSNKSNYHQRYRKNGNYNKPYTYSSHSDLKHRGYRESNYDTRRNANPWDMIIEEYHDMHYRRNRGYGNNEYDNRRYRAYDNYGRR